MKVRFLTDRSDGIESGQVVDLDPAEAERVITAGGGVPVHAPKRKRPTTASAKPAGRDPLTEGSPP